MEYPIFETYPAVYRDRHGTETTVIYNDGQRVWCLLRGITFIGWMLDDFEPAPGADPDVLATFTLQRGENYTELCGCELEWDMPAQVVARPTKRRQTCTRDCV